MLSVCEGSGNIRFLVLAHFVREGVGAAKRATFRKQNLLEKRSGLVPTGVRILSLAVIFLSSHKARKLLCFPKAFLKMSEIAYDF